MIDLTMPLSIATNWNDTFWGAVAVPLAVAAVAALVAVLGYLYDRRNRRKDELRTLFSESLQAVAEYQELPYLIRRRSEQSPMTPADLTARASAVQTRLDYFQARLELESIELGRIYSTLVTTVRGETGPDISDAWRHSRIRDDEKMPLGAAYSRDRALLVRAECLQVMRGWLWKRPDSANG